MAPADWKNVFRLIGQAVELKQAPSLNVLTHEGADPFQILIATLLSLRTRDEVTLKASRALFGLAAAPHEVIRLAETDLAQTIFPVGFYKTKARQILEICRILIEKYRGEVPKSREELLALPGVGPKTANLVLGLAFEIQAICVDTHVHRISNRLDWVRTSSPEETERALEIVLPQEAWIKINEVFVLFGQSICGPASPRCSLCPLVSDCPRRGVLRSR